MHEVNWEILPWQWPSYDISHVVSKKLYLHVHLTFPSLVEVKIQAQNISSCPSKEATNPRSIK
jgi:hypothetical protein